MRQQLVPKDRLGYLLTHEAQRLRSAIGSDPAVATVLLGEAKAYGSVAAFLGLGPLSADYRRLAGEIRQRLDSGLTEGVGR